MDCELRGMRTEVVCCHAIMTPGSSPLDPLVCICHVTQLIPAKHVLAENSRVLLKIATQRATLEQPCIPLQGSALLVLQKQSIKIAEMQAGSLRQTSLSMTAHDSKH